MLLSILLALIGLVLLVVGGEALLRGAVALATLMRLTPAVIGLTVVAAGTSVPELAVSLFAGLRGSSDISVGNVVGSNIFNIGAIIGLGALVRPLVISGNTTRLEYPVLVLVTLMAVTLCRDGTIDRLDAVLLLSVYVGFTVYLVSLVRGQVNAAESAEFRGEVRELGSPAGTQPRLGVNILLLIVGIVLLGLGASATVEGASDLARRLGISERIIGLTIVAAGTGLPELVTTLVSTYRGRDDIAVANVLGSNLFNLLGVLGLNGLIQPIAIDATIMARDNWWMFALTLVLGPMLITFGRRICRIKGALLLGIYLVYLVLLIRS